ncbi:MAG: anthrax toxin-like adenylyl cyclase domain-containing protein [Adhaeribacter sp.]
MPDKSLFFRNLDRYIKDAAREELHKQGFPDYMIFSFMQSAKETNTVISSRLPGPAGPDLIQEGYDLKGFQIKAKSCDWGPMGGFICQLPFFNKYGFPKVDYNAEYIAHYLKNLSIFKGNKEKIASINKARKEEIEKIDRSTDNYKTNINNINKKFDGQILAVLEKYKKDEQETGEWSGENSQPEGVNAPFVHLKRKFSGDIKTILGNLKGVDKGSLKFIDKQIYGIASNDFYSDDAKLNKATVLVEFLLVADGKINDLWAIYHGRIYYKKTKEDTVLQEYKQGIVGTKIYEKYPVIESASVSKPTAETNKEILDQIFNYALSPVPVKYNTSDINKFPAKENNEFYPVQGFMNPHPPYKNGNNDFYKNAVSGDYDLFAFWPNIPAVNVHELIRISELKIGKQLRMGGKILTTFLGDNADLGIEFIPGFGELNPAKDQNKKIIPGEELKESAELGNINLLGQTVAATVNSFAGALCLKEYKNAAQANKAFHSDEGGRPGVMEIEFPIAVFFPAKFASKALNNLYVGNEKDQIPPFAPREEVFTHGGLIKTAEELLQLISECQEANTEIPQFEFKKDTDGNYIKGDDDKSIIERRIINRQKNHLVMMHSEWMMHLFFISLAKEEREAFVGKKGDLYDKVFKELKVNEPSKVDDKIKEFKAIESNLNPGFNQREFEKSLKTLLLAKSGIGANNTEEINTNYFNELRDVFLTLAFQSGRKAYERRRTVEKVLEKYHRIYPNYLP